MTELSIDLETYSELDIRDVGAFRYAEHHSTEILMMAYAIDDFEPSIWYPDCEPMPWDLLAVINNGEATVHAFNAQFERALLAAKCPSLYSLIHPWRWRCTMVEAYALSFTGGLDSVIEQAGLDIRKDPRGDVLIKRFSKPQPRGRKVRRWTRENDPLGFNEFAAYCRQDVRAERALRRWIARRYNLTPIEIHHTMITDPAINERGVRIDTDLVAAAQAMRDAEFARADQELAILTGLRNPNSVTQLRDWLAGRGCVLDNLQAATVEARLRRDDQTHTLDPLARRALEIRQQRGLSSLAKYDALDRATCSDGRLRGVLQTRGASRTGRYAGRIFQPQNLPRGAGERTDAVCGAILDGERESVIVANDSPVLDALSDAVRGCVVPSGISTQSLVVCDYSSIESRVLGWLAGCTRVIETFASGRDTYKDFAVELFNVPYDEVTKKQRTYCKPPVLGCGYRLGGAGLVAYAEGMGVEMLHADADRVVKLYRDTYPEIPRFWRWIETACIKAVGNGEVIEGYRMRVWCDGEFLYIQLPSGRKLAYYQPIVRDEMMPWGEPRLCVSYMGQDSRTKQWVRIKSHGGIATENIVQAIAYDILVAGINRCVQRGLDVVLHVHDEIVVEADDDVAHDTLELMRSEMSRAPTWAPDLLLGAEGFVTKRYRKD